MISKIMHCYNTLLTNELSCNLTECKPLQTWTYSMIYSDLSHSWYGNQRLVRNNFFRFRTHCAKKYQYDKVDLHKITHYPTKHYGIVS